MKFEEEHKDAIIEAYRRVEEEYKPRAIIDMMADQDFEQLQEFIDEFPLNAFELHKLVIMAIENNISCNAAEKAKARHTETYEKQAAIVAYWRDNIGADKSNEFAAELLQKQFPETAHRTLARYVSEAKKIPPAGTL